MIEAFIVLLLSAIAGALIWTAKELRGLALRAPSSATFWVPPEAIDGIERAVERGLSKIAIPPANTTINQVTVPNVAAARALAPRPEPAPRYLTTGGYLSTAPQIFHAAASSEWWARCRPGGIVPVPMPSQIIEDRAVGGLETEIREAERTALYGNGETSR